MSNSDDRSRSIESAREVIIMGANGVWSRGPSFDAAYNAARKSGGFNRSFLVVVVPVAAQAFVDEFDGLILRDKSHGYKLARKGNKAVWANNPRDPELRSAVAALLAN
jgi:hypothetical protein